MSHRDTLIKIAKRLCALAIPDLTQAERMIVRDLIEAGIVERVANRNVLKSRSS